MTKRWELPILFFAVALARLATTLTIVGLLFTTSVHDVLLDHKNIAVASLGLGFALDLVISLTLAYLLVRTPGNFPRGERNFKRILLFSVESGFVSFLLGIPMVITVSINSFNYVWLAFVFIIAKVNSNSILVTLNSRHALANSYATPQKDNSRLRSLQFSFNNKGESVAIAKTQVTTTMVSSDDSRSFGRINDYSISKGGLSYPPQ